MGIADVAIIGAGIHGASVAYHLATTGLKPVIFERGHPACGPTGFSSAVCRAYYTNEFLAQVAHEALEMFENFDHVSGGRDAGFRRTGALFFHSANEESQVERVTSFLNGIGTKVERLDLAELEQRFPFFDLSAVGFGCWEPGAGYADPTGTTHGLIGRAIELGADLRLYTPVVDISHNESDEVVITTADGDRICAARLLIAAGPWTRPLAARLGVELPLTVERHFVANCAWGQAEPVSFAFADTINDYYFRPEGEAQFLIGPLVEEPQVDPDDYQTEILPDEWSGLLGALVKRVPHLVESEPRGGWASLYDVTPDWQPIIGEIAPNIFVDCGTSGHGFKLAPALGRHVADLVIGDGHENGLSQFSPNRFRQAGLSIGSAFAGAKILG